MAEQRVYHFLLVHAQEPRVICIASVKPLNMELFLGVSREFRLAILFQIENQGQKVFEHMWMIYNQNPIGQTHPDPTYLCQ